MSDLKNGIRNGCAIEIFCGLIILLIVTQCACLSSLPVEPAPASLVVKGVNTPAVIPTATPAELIREVCPHVGNVNLRKAADSESDILAVLKMGDSVTLTGEPVIAPDMGLWWPVDTETGSGYINARYVCE